MIVYAFSSSIQETESVDLYDFEASMIYGASSRTVKADQTNPDVKHKQAKKKKKDTKNPTPILYYDSRLVDCKSRKAYIGICFMEILQIL